MTHGAETAQVNVEADRNVTHAVKKRSPSLQVIKSSRDTGCSPTQYENPFMYKLALASAFAALVAISAPVSAEGALKGAAVGAAVGDVAGHHAVGGAEVGAAVGMHRANKAAC